VVRLTWFPWDSHFAFSASVGPLLALASEY
jgi:hypothetical protein